MGAIGNQLGAACYGFAGYSNWEPSNLTLKKMGDPPPKKKMMLGTWNTFKTRGDPIKISGSKVFVCSTFGLENLPRKKHGV